MDSSYQYIPSPDYINSLVFACIETYSFQRGADFEQDQKTSGAAYQALKAKKEKQQNLTTAEEEHLSAMHSRFGFTQYLVNDDGVFHPSSRRTHTFRPGDPEIERIRQILNTPVNDIPQWLCAPMYRDALVFRNSNSSIVSVLNICLSCEYMETAMFHQVNSDQKTYGLFRQFFTDMGHGIEI